MDPVLAEQFPYTVSLTGRILQSVFETDVDLSEFVPAPLHVPDPHHGLIKAYHLRLRREPDPVSRPKYSQYRQVCLTVSAAPRGLPLRHYNLLLWADRDWATQGATPYGWRKKHAEVELTWTFPGDGRFDRDPSLDTFVAEVYRYGDPILLLEASLDGGTGHLAAQEPEFGGFYSVFPAADGTSEPRVREATVYDLSFHDLAFGTGGTVQLRAVPDDPPGEADLMTRLGNLAIAGSSLRDVTWRRTPANDKFVA